MRGSLKQKESPHPQAAHSETSGSMEVGPSNVEVLGCLEIPAHAEKPLPE